MSEKSLNAIGEMVRILINFTKKNHISASTAILTDYAEELYEEGYRKQEWISVDERLPDKYGDFICCTRRGTIWQLTYNPKYKLFNVSHDNVENAMDVTHWMPLPEAPKGGAQK